MSMSANFHHRQGNAFTVVARELEGSWWLSFADDEPVGATVAIHFDSHDEIRQTLQRVLDQLPARPDDSGDRADAHYDAHGE